MLLDGVFAAAISAGGNVFIAFGGSLFYGTVLGIFTVALFLRRVQGTAVFVAALLSEALVIVLFLRTNIGFLWYNVVGCAAVVLISATASIQSSLVSRVSPDRGSLDGVDVVVVGPGPTDPVRAGIVGVVQAATRRGLPLLSRPRAPLPGNWPPSCGPCGAGARPSRPGCPLSNPLRRPHEPRRLNSNP